VLAEVIASVGVGQDKRPRDSRARIEGGNQSQGPDDWSKNLGGESAKLRNLCLCAAALVTPVPLELILLSGRHLKAAEQGRRRPTQSGFGRVRITRYITPVPHRHYQQ
jgi:hypothetical protein